MSVSRDKNVVPAVLHSLEIYKHMQNTRVNEKPLGSLWHNHVPVASRTSVGIFWACRVQIGFTVYNFDVSVFLEYICCGSLSAFLLVISCVFAFWVVPQLSKQECELWNFLRMLPTWVCPWASLRPPLHGPAPLFISASARKPDVGTESWSCRESWTSREGLSRLTFWKL